MIRPVNAAKIIEGRYNDIPKQSWENNKNNTPVKKKNSFINYNQPTYSDEEWERILKLNEERFYIP